MALLAGKQEQMVIDLDVIKNAFDVLYAPAEWKKRYANWDLEENIALAKKRVRENRSISVDEYQTIVRNFFNTTHDYHVNVLFCSEEMAALPFRIQGVDGKYIVAGIADPSDEAKRLTIPLQVGDEVLTFDGQPVAQLVQKLKVEHFGERHSPTDEAIAESYLTRRVKMLGCREIPQGLVTITVRHKVTNRVKSYTLEWIYKPEVIQNHFKGAIAKNEASKKGLSLKENPLMQREMITPIYSAWKKADRLLFSEEESKDEENDTGWLSSKRGFLPYLGPVVWEASHQESFHAYIFKGPKQQLIGFIRIPAFMGSDEEAEAFGSIIAEMQKQTSALVIDQTNNPGGNLFYMLALLSMLSEEPMLLPTQRETITQKHVFDAVMAIEAIRSIRDKKSTLIEEEEDVVQGYHIGENFDVILGRYYQFLINEWNNGSTITQNVPIMGIEHILPHPQYRYTKPILFLVNHLDFSCADFMPSVLQDNRRATIMGSRTAGAGGYLINESYPNLFGIEAFTYTGSIAERPNKQPIENLGITPDIPCEVTLRDLKEGYPDYIQAVRRALDNILYKKRG